MKTIKEHKPHSGLQVYCFGGCQILNNRGQVLLESAKTRALLVFLMMNPGPQTRDKLVTILWGELPESKARRNLRHALWNLNRQLYDPEEPPLLIANQQSVTFEHRLGCWLDVALFEKLVSEKTDLPASPAGNTSGFQLEQISRLRQAAEIYQGDFLDGFHVRNAPSFEEWALVERERLRFWALTVLQRLSEQIEGQQDYTTALIYARRWVAMDPWREEAHRQVMRLHAQSGNRGEALAQYETCQRILAEELGIEPGHETRALYHHIKEGANHFSEKTDVTPHLKTDHLPAQTTPFIGRERELAELSALLNTPECRLVTIAGPGGIGKTRLALQVAAHFAKEKSNPVHFVPLASLNSVEFILPAVMNELGLPYRKPADVRSTLMASLHEQEALLVFDNFEHLSSGAAILGEILAGAPRFKILVTSRQRLNLYGEWVFELAGLPVPPDAHSESLRKYDAVQLFLQGARRVSLGYTLQKADWLPLVQLCQLLEGVPLAIELAAAWSRTLSCKEIVSEIERNLDFLHAEWPNAPHRHRSLRATFQHSWGLLSQSDQNALMRLSVFCSPFRAKAARHVAGVSLHTLSRLVDRSLLVHHPDGFYQSHAVLRYYAGQYLHRASLVEENARDQLSDYYAAFLAESAAEFMSAGQKKALQEVRQVIGDIRAGWEWAIARRRIATLNRCLEGLYLFYDLQGWFQEGEEAFRRAIQALSESPGAPHPAESTPMAGRMLSRQAVFCRRQGKLPAAQDLLHQALKHFADNTAHLDKAFTYNQLGNIADQLGDYHQARESYQKSLKIWRSLGDQKGISIALNNLGLAAQRLGEYDDAIRQYQASLAIKQELGYQWGIALTLDNLANATREQGRYNEARDYFRQALQIAWDIQAVTQVLEILVGIAELDACVGAIERATEMLFFVKSQPTVEQETKDRAGRLLASLRDSTHLDIQPGMQIESTQLDLEAAVSRILT